MKYFATLLAILISATAVPVTGQQAGVGTIVRTDPALDRLVSPGTKIEKLQGGFRFIEGPVWARGGKYLLFSDLQSNAIMKWSPQAGASVFRSKIFSGSYPDGVQIGSNGLT